jgi:hypothetical protein
MSKIAVSLLGMIPALAFAHDDHSYRCTSGDAVRRIEVEHADGTPVPCSVNYIKDTEAAGASEEIYNAQNEAGYCEARAEEFAARLEGFGWQCEVVAPTPAVAGVVNVILDDSIEGVRVNLSYQTTGAAR